MSIEYLAAEDEIFGVANVAWIAACQAADLSYTPQLVFPGQTVQPPNVTQVYSQCSFAVVTDQQIGLARVGGKSLYEAVGLFVLQIYAPKNDATAFRTAKTIAGIVRDAFRTPSPSGEIWFRNQKLSPAPGNASSFQVNAVITCTFKTEK